jgi:broad specificity phosphatase PhoE
VVTVTVRLHLIVPGLSPGARRGLVGAGDGLDDHSREAVLRCARRWPDDLATTSAPDHPCTQTAGLLGLHASVDRRVRDWDLGTWTGRSLTEIASTSSQDLEHWTTDPDFAVHGGESLTQFRLRVTDWLDQVETEGHPRLVTVAPVAVVRAALVSVLDAQTTTFWRLDLEPLTSTHISLRPGRRAVRWPTGDTRG